MQTRYIVPVGSLCVGLPTVLFLIPRLMIGTPPEDAIGSFDGWRPTPYAIRQTVRIGPDGAYNDPRHKQFALMFTERFRSNHKAVRITFEPNGKLKAKFAASIPRWDMAHVAIELHREAEGVFKRNYDVDIYETYISLSAHKLAELRQAGPGAMTLVNFDPKFVREEAVKERLRPNPMLPMIAFTPYLAPAFCPNPIVWAVYLNQHITHHPPMRKGGMGQQPPAGDPRAPQPESTPPVPL